ncbi:MAG: hypothetical protein VB080_03445 [Propionicimonas sp.]|uniref:hypothetical protein n=1 Tax=Propionicimonas sp. TaxID=1955623 RepID=UPI002B1EE515|nr:hypothetical protein [Propionicimonas sp.]MEA4943472.1 hypothetical protein [Propionicimonas sp.]MEA5051934.1 hypothetical protein [Propionicimonas sp.]MEA5118331.1 hypothetical protein [Propionicimonas sp.]
MKRAVQALVTLVVAGMLVLTGCSGNSPRVAAEVNGVVIPEATVDAISQGLAAGNGEPEAAGTWRRTAASILISNEIARQVGAKTGASVSADDVTQAVESSDQLKQLAATPELAAFIHDFANTQLLASQLGKDAFMAAAADFTVVVNPRYGEFDPTTLQLGNGTGSLSSPAPAAAA